MTAPEYAARWRVIHHLLDLVNRSGLGEHIVLRGSLLMKAWFGEAAREPGDMDWLVRDATVTRYFDRTVRDKVNDFVRLVGRKPDADGVSINVRKITDAPIGGEEYTLITGRRLVFPWRGTGQKSGTMQVDIAFDDAAMVPPSWTLIPNPVGEPTGVWAASPAESLAWKLSWLQHDASPNVPTGTKAKGKDLYDAVLLAESTPLPLDLLQRPAYARGIRMDYLSEDFPLTWDVDWEPFVQAHPFVTGTAEEWQVRLAIALAPTFTDEERERAEVALSRSSL